MTTRRHRSDDVELDALYAEAAAEDLQPLWELDGLLPLTPNGLTPHIWRWQTLHRLAEQAGKLVGIGEGGDRRVLSLSHPDLDGRPFATPTLWAGIQYLNPGESAPAHRHSPAALRFVLEGSGVWTLVNGDPLSMEPGDLVLTPSFNWHEHHNPTDSPMIWFDGLDLPLVQSLDAVFFENGPEALSSYTPRRRSQSETLYGFAGIRPVMPPLPVQPSARRQHSALLVYRWEQTDQILNDLTSMHTEGEAKVRFVDPMTGMDAMPTIRAEMRRVQAGFRTETTRSVGSTIVVVREGSGSSMVSGQEIDWSARDIFVVPSWASVSHRAEKTADLFEMSDAPVMEALNLANTVVLRDETEDPGAQGRE